MTRIQGWGGVAEMTPRRIHATYAAGVFESSRLVVVGLMLLVAASWIVAGLASMRAGLHPWGLLMQLAAVPCLGIALWRLMDIARSVWTAGDRRILVRHGWVEIGSTEVRRLKEATLHQEPARVGFGAAFSRLSLRFPDGSRVLLVQGPREEIDRFAVILTELMGPASSR